MENSLKDVLVTSLREDPFVFTFTGTTKLSDVVDLGPGRTLTDIEFRTAPAAGDFSFNCRIGDPADDSVAAVAGDLVPLMEIGAYGTAYGETITNAVGGWPLKISQMKGQRYVQLVSAVDQTDLVVYGAAKAL